MDKIKIFLYALFAIILFALADYFGYGLIGRDMSYDADGNMTLVNAYRIAQMGVLLLITVFFMRRWNFRAGVCFFVMWWTGVADLAYYGWFDLLKIYSPEYAGKAFILEVMGDTVTWLFFSPAGLLTALIHQRWDNALTGGVILVQAGIGAAIAAGLSVVSYEKKREDF